MFDDVCLRFKSAICNELGEVVAWCEDITDEEVQATLDEHEDYYLNCVMVEV